MVIMDLKRNMPLLITIPLILFSYLDFVFIKALLTWMIIYSTMQIIKTKNQTLLILQLFMIMYFLYIIPFIFLGLPLSIFQTIYDSDMYENISGVLRTQSLFFSIFISLLPVKESTPIISYIKISDKKLPYLFSLGLMLFSFMNIPFSETIFASKYSIDTSSTIYFDYFLIFALINYCYSSTKFQKNINFILIFAMAFMPLLFGKRLASIQILILLFILYFEGRLNNKYIYLITFSGYIFNSLFAFYRVHSVKGVIDGLFGLNDDDILNNNQTGVWFASEIIYKLINDGNFDLTFRIKSIVGTFLNSFLPTFLTPPEALINIYIMENGLAPFPGNGGLIGVYGYLWFGYLGTVIFAIIIAKIIHTGYKANKQFFICSTVLLLCTLPKWYTYNIRIIFKFAFIFFVLYVLSILLSQLFTTPKKISVTSTNNSNGS